MTHIYFIRHAESDYSVRDSWTRPLTEKGRADCRLVTEFLHNRDIDIVLSSPYKRAVDTLRDFADQYGFEIWTMDGFCEQRSDSGHLSRAMDFSTLMKRLWADFDYKVSDGESLSECQARNIAALEEVLAHHRGKNIAIGTHGVALSTIINHYDPTFGYADFMAKAFIFPWVVKMSFDENGDAQGCVYMEGLGLEAGR